MTLPLASPRRTVAILGTPRDSEQFMDWIAAYMPKAAEQCKCIPLVLGWSFFSGDPKAQCRILFDWVRANLHYQADPWANQTILLPATLLEQKRGDCKSYSLLTYGLLKACGICAGLCFAGYGNNASQPTHVYAIAQIGRDWYPIDTTTPHCFKAVDPTYTKTFVL